VHHLLWQKVGMLMVLQRYSCSCFHRSIMLGLPYGSGSELLAWQDKQVLRVRGLPG
jgi:hypothetical protein